MLSDQTTLGVSSKGNTRALCLCLSSVLLGKMRPAHIQVRLEGDMPQFNDFYLEQLTELARFHGVSMRITVAKSTGVRDSRDWQLDSCKTPFLWMVDEDVIVDPRCLEAYYQVWRDMYIPAYYAGSKGDVNNRRGYPFFDASLKGPADVIEGCSHSHWYHVDACWGKRAPTQVLDTGNTLLNVIQIKNAGCTFRQFPDQGNPSGDATTFSLVLAKAGLSGIFVPSARAYHLEKPGPGFNEFEARKEMLLRTCDLKGLDKGILYRYWMPGTFKEHEKLNDHGKGKIGDGSAIQSSHPKTVPQGRKRSQGARSRNRPQKTR